MNLEFHPEFHLDVLEAANYYDAQREGLGNQFAIEVWAAVQRLKENPQLSSKIYRDVRRTRLVRFKEYAVRYRLLEANNLVRILGVFHAKRHPKYGTARL